MKNFIAPSSKEIHPALIFFIQSNLKRPTQYILGGWGWVQVYFVWVSGWTFFMGEWG